MKPLPRLLSLAALLTLALSFAACTPEDLIDIFDDEPETPATPSNPDTSTDKNTVTVTPEGSKVRRGDFSINFPSGTFTEDVQVTVTDVKAGEVYGDLEVSKFYKVKMPVTTNKSSTIRIKSKKLDDDVVFIRRVESWARSAGKSVEVGNVLEADYVEGEYKVTLPIYDNGKETEREEFIIGLAHPAKPDQTRANAVTRSSETAVAEGEVKGIKWKIYIDPKAKKVADSWKVLNNDGIAKVNGYIKEAITKILDLGFELRDKNRVIPYYYVSDNARWGYFSQGLFSDKDSWIGISVENLIGRPDETAAPKSTLIHETFHYFQSDYDPRCAYSKKGGFAGSAVDNENILYEMGAVWIEQFMRNGNLDPVFVKQEFDDVFKGDRLGFGLEEERWGLGKHDSNQKQGYIMAPYLYYLTTEWKDIFLKKDFLNLHLLWREKWKSGTYNSYYIFYEWVKNQHDVYLLDFTDIDNYYLHLLKGELVKGFDFRNLSCLADNDHAINHTSTKKKFDFTGKCYPYGCGAQKVVVHGFPNMPITDKEIVVSQMNSGVQTYLVWMDGIDNEKYHCFMKDGQPFAAAQGDVIVISGEELEAFRRNIGSFYFNFYLITTNTVNSIHSTRVNPYHATFELRDRASGTVTPQELSFTAEGGMQTLKVTSTSFKKFGFTISDEYKTWLSGKTVTGGSIEVTAQPNTSTEERTGYVKVYLTNEQEPTEAQKTYIGTVKVTQQGKATSDKIPVHVSFTVNLEKSRWTHFWNDGDTYTTTSNLNWSQFYDQYRFYAFPSTITTRYEFIEMTQDEQGVHFNCYITYTQGEKTHSTLTFDLDNLDKLADGTAVITNIQSEDEWNFGDQSTVSKLSTHAKFKMDAPLRNTSGPYDQPGWDGALWELKGDAVSFDALTQHHYYKGELDSYYSDYISHPDNKISLSLNFLHDARASSAPRKRTPLAASSTSSAQVLPGSSHGQADLE